MEFLGKIVKKEFTGHGVFSGIVKSYNASSGFFEIVYEDGDSEELDFSEVASLLQHKEAQPADHKHRLGRGPKKRLRVEPRKREDRGGGGESGNSNSNSYNQMIAETLGRRIVEANGNFDMNRNVDLNGGLIGVLRETELGSANSGIMTVDLNEAFEKGSGVEENIRENEYGIGSLSGNGGMKKVLDLNAGLNLNLNEGFDLNVEDGINADLHDNLKKRKCIDLNLDVNGDVDENLTALDVESNHLEGQKRKCGFDLNLGIDEEFKDDADGVCGGNARQATSDEMVKETTQKIVDTIGVSERVHNEFDIENGTLQEVPVTNDSCLEFAKGMWKKDIVIDKDFRGFDSVEVQDTKTILEDSPEVIDENQGDCRSAYREGSAGRRRGRRRLNDANNLNVTPETMLFADATVMYGNQNDISVHKEGNPHRSWHRRGKVANTWNSTPDTTIIEDALVVKEDCSMETDQKQGDSGSACKEVSGSRRKRRKRSDNVNAAQEMTVLRRSARRGSVKTDVSTTTTLSALNDISASPAGSALTEEKPMKSCHEWPEEPGVLPAKVQLPPSSQNLDLGGISVADFFSVYSCLRSFSTLLFLSPFELEDFVAALKCNSPSSLFDCIHVSILQMLRKHLEYLSNEGSESASNCLRSLNWDLLDLVTWPIFMVEYLLMHGSDLKPGFNLSQLKLLKDEYYKQSVSVKVEILRCLCDGVIEVEAIRTELNRRSSGAESDLDFERNMNLGTLKKRRNEMDALGASCLTDEAVDDTTDWNSDECCLCKMDGSLICCDGCPAAYHSKCVGVPNDSLPEGDWFCPECAIDRHKPWMKCRGSVRGAELLGVDPYGRLYFNSCGYLLISDSCESESSFNYYHRDDLNAVIKLLRSSEMIYSSILEAIHKHWDIPVSLYGASSNVYLLNHALSLDISMLPAALASSETCRINNKIADERKPIDNFVAGSSGHTNIMASKSASQTYVSSEGSAETTQTSLENQNFPKEESNFSNKSTGCLNESDIPRKSPPVGGNSLSSTCLDLKSKNIIGSASNDDPSSTLNETNGGTSQVQMGTGYMNYYSFGHMASSIAEELMCKSSDKSIDNSIKTDEEIISSQMKIISKKCANFHWPYIPRLNVDVQKEKCGWCFSCRVSSDDSGCLFNMSLGPVQGGSVTEVVGLQSKKGKKGHLTDIISHILVIEDRLQGLLLGPWLNPHYSRLWRKIVLKASNIDSVKYLLLTLESNIRHLALSAEWLKHVDSGIKVGSAAHIIMASSRPSSKNGISRKRARYSEFESCPSNSASGLGMLWWRGGRLSRQLFSWKMLPHSLVSKAARQAGCMKIPGMLYPENSDFAKRSKYIAWRAAVESSTTAEQLALQVRELDSNIRWDEIWNTTLLSLVDKEFRKSIRLFKKAVVRRKSVGDGTKYLLDFGKRRSIPEIVLKNGCVVEESSSERKKYWLNETYVPLYLLKSFEEKKIARRSSKISSGKLSDDSIVMKKPSKKSGFSYLLAKADRSEYHQCGHCNKNVPIRDAVCCQYCKGFFHKRHVRKSAGSITTECIYSCHRCANGKNLKNDSKTGKTNARSGKINNKSKKVQHQNLQKASARAVRLENSKKQLRSAGSLKSQKNKKVTVIVPLRRSPRKTKYNSLQNKKVRGRKKNKQVKPRKATCKESTKVNSWRKKRTQAYHSYWLKGLLLSRKPDDERVMRFRMKSFLGPSESVIIGQPKCCLCCEAGYRSTSTYISCEMCGEWFHGDAFGLSRENSNMLIGFRCHMCRNSAPPICPLVPIIENHGSQIPDVQTDVRNEVSGKPTNVIRQLSETNLTQESFANEVCQCSLPVDESAHRKEQLGTTTISEQCSVPESRLEVDNGHLFDNIMENTDAIQGSNENLNTDNTVESGDDVVVTTNDQMEPASCNVDVDVIVTEMGSSTCDDVRDGLVTPIPKYPIDGIHNAKEKTIESSDAMITSFDQMQPASCNIGADVTVTEMAPSGRESAKDGLTTPIR